MLFSYTVQKLLNLLPHFVTNCLRKLKFGKPFQSILRQKVRLIFTDDFKYRTLYFSIANLLINRVAQEKPLIGHSFLKT